MERHLSYIALFAAFIAVLGLVPRIDLAFGVPVTMQTLGIMLCGAVLGPWRGALAALLFVAPVAMGLPLLAGGRGGLGVFAGPTMGYVIGFPVAAFVTGAVMRYLPAPVMLSAGMGAFLGGVVVLHLCGIMGLSIILNKTFYEAVLMDMVFIPGDMIKAVLCAVITAKLAELRPAVFGARG